MKFAELDLNKVYTYADYFKWKFEERVELIKGKIFRMSPAPSTIHQKLCGEISGELWSYLRDKKCQVFSAPFDVRLPRKSSDDKEIYTVLQPDVCVICDPTKLDKRGCLGAPDIVVEVLSPGNNAKELKNKYEVYEEAGVKEYWIVQPQYCSFVQYKLANGKYQPSRQLTTGDVVTTDILEGFVLDLTALFAEIDEEQTD
jgi:Uma2 family endonuclease